MEWAVSQGARPYEGEVGTKIADLPAIYGIGDSLIYFVDTYGEGADAYAREYDPVEGVPRRPEQELELAGLAAAVGGGAEVVPLDVESRHAERRALATTSSSAGCCWQRPPTVRSEPKRCDSYRASTTNAR